MSSTKKKVHKAINHVKSCFPEIFNRKEKANKRINVRPDLRKNGYTRRSKTLRYEVWYKIVNEDKKDAIVVHLFSDFGLFCRVSYQSTKKSPYFGFYDGGKCTLSELRNEIKQAHRYTEVKRQRATRIY